MEPFDEEWRASAIPRMEELERVARKYEEGWETAKPDLKALFREYMLRLPQPVVCSDPFTGDPVSIAIDTFGLDGPWWDLDGPVRPYEEPLPPTFYAFHGSMRLFEPYEDFGHSCWTGAIAPYVVPRLLLRPGVVAVIAERPIGHHQGWITVYFAEPPQPAGTRVCEWGRKEYRVRRGAPDGPFVSETAFIYPVEWDYDLRPWIESGRLFWVPPGEPAAPVRREVEGCPYLDLLGPDDPKGLGMFGYGSLKYVDYNENMAGIDNPNED